MSTVSVIREEPKQPPIKEVVLTVSEDQARLIWAYLYRTGGSGKWRDIGVELKMKLAAADLKAPINSFEDKHAYFDKVFLGANTLTTNPEA